jgi:hypothetical protein
MANQVYANTMEVSCKAADGKAICSFPDVCMTPPQTPATPPGVPIPYPNTGMASDCSDGSSTVKISDQEIMLKDQSYFKRSSGDEAGCAPMKGVVTSTNMGKVYFTAWSMDVLVEGQNVVRNLDLTTHNHASAPGNTVVWPYLDSMSAAQYKECKKDAETEMEACKDCTPYGSKDPCPPDPGKPLSDDRDAHMYSEQMLNNDCLKARRCMLSPYKPKTCCGAQTPHHLVEASAFHAKGRGFGKPNLKSGANVKIAGTEAYHPNKAPCICAEGVNHGVGTHGLMHTFQSDQAMNCAPSGFTASGASGGGALESISPKGKITDEWNATTLGDAQKSAAAAVSKTFPESKCSEKCIEAQLANYHENTAKMDKTQPIKAVHTCSPDEDDLADAESLLESRADIAAHSSAAPAGAFG